MARNVGALVALGEVRSYLARSARSFVVLRDPNDPLLVQGLTFVYLQKFVVPGQDATRPDIAEFIVCLIASLCSERRGERTSNLRVARSRCVGAARDRYLFPDPKT